MSREDDDVWHPGTVSDNLHFSVSDELISRKMHPMPVLHRAATPLIISAKKLCSCLFDLRKETVCRPDY